MGRRWLLVYSASSVGSCRSPLSKFPASTILTGGTVFTDELDVKLERAPPDLLVSTGSITITKCDTIILNSVPSKLAVSRSVTSQPNPTTSEFEYQAAGTAG